MGRLAPVLPVLRQVVARYREARVSFLAAALAYYGFVSVVPLLLLVLGVGSALGFDVTDLVLATIGDLLTPAGDALVTEALAGAGLAQGASLVGLGFLAWSASKVFLALDVAFADVYGARGQRGRVGQLRDAGIVLAVVPLAVVAAATLGVGVPARFDGRLALVLAPVSLAIALTLVLLPVYHTFPDVPVAVREVFPGTVVAALGWTALATGFGVYARFVPAFELYGILGAVLLLVTWLYLGGVIIMLGAVVNVVLAGRSEDGREDAADERGDRPERVPDLTEVAREVRALRADLDEKTVSKDDLERDLERYVRRKARRSKARGWGPYLVLLYGTAMTLGAFVWLSGGWAILAMLVIWLSTLGLYVLMVLFGIGFNAMGVPGTVLDWIRERRS
ncbi:MAG: YihY/virulence factor BrkB family protein [Halanaeroarchaeum sp.]